MMRQPVPLVDQDDVKRIIQRDFPEDAQEAVQVILSKYEHKEEYRVQVAALKNSNGDIEILKQQIDSANCDYRDLLSNAEYPAYSKQWSRMESASDEERNKVIQADWEQYQTWLNK